VDLTWSFCGRDGGVGKMERRNGKGQEGRGGEEEGGEKGRDGMVVQFSDQKVTPL